MTEPVRRTFGSAWLKIAAAFIALFGLGDSVYLTAHHYSAEPVPCSITGGCEQVLTSEYAEIGGIPLALFGAAAYFAAFSLALLAYYGDRRSWKIFRTLAFLMAGFSGWLIYVQASVIGAFCQFCLLSALSSILLALIAAGSVFVSENDRPV